MSRISQRLLTQKVYGTPVLHTARPWMHLLQTNAPKRGKRFGFIRFLRIKDSHDFARSLSNVWIGSFHLYVLVAHFPRGNASASQPTNIIPFKYDNTKPKLNPNSSYREAPSNKPTFAVVIHNKPKPTETTYSPVTERTITLNNNDLINIEDSSTVLLLKLNELESMSNMYAICKNEGFMDLLIHHVGGLWIRIQFSSSSFCSKFQENSTMKNLYSSIKTPLPSFKVDERMIWIDISGLPLCAWGSNGFKKVASLFVEVNGEMFDVQVHEIDMDLFSLIRALNPTKVKTGSRPRAAHEVPLLTMTATRVIEMEDPAAATDSSGVPSIIERSPLDFASEAGPEDQGTMALEVLLLEDVPTTIGAPGASQTESVAVTTPPVITESRKRSSDGVDANAPPKVLRRDHADPRPTGSNRGGKSLAAIELGLGSTHPTPVLPSAPADASDPDPLSFANPKSHPPTNVAQSSQGNAVAGDPKSKNTSYASMVESPESVATLQEQVSGEEKLKAAYEEFKRYEDSRVEQRCAKMDACLDALSIDFDEELYPHMLTAIAGRRQAFADVVSAGIAKGMSEGLRDEVDHGQAQLTLDSIEAYDPEAKTKYIAALQALKDLKYPLVDQLEGLKDAPMDVRDPVNPWACKEEMLLVDAIAANVSRAEKKKKCRIVCRTHGVGSAHHAWSDGVPVSVPTIIPQGLAILLANAATQTDTDEATLDNL
nr:RNA-directed DNA polymerase, eukaryota, nucleotide-binding alpha-beta plait domain protein [Tanacetum cinerariifolium]